jgi:molybdopterin-guanine dinucleotide biosynthesis protein A
MADFPDLTVAILAGGQSRRMGQDKAFVRLGDRPMIAHVLDAVAGLAAERLIIANPGPAYAALGVPVVADLIPACGPLGGLYTALMAMRTPWLLLVGCDMPWLQRPVLAWLAGLRGESADFPIIVPEWEGRLHPLHALYARPCAEAILPRLHAGELRMHAFVRSQRALIVPQNEIARLDPGGQSLRNINTPEALRLNGDPQSGQGLAE